MEPQQYAIMSVAEERHWWYLGLRDAIACCMARDDLRFPSIRNVLDAGCGTGGNLKFLRSHFAPSYLAGFDASELAVAEARKKCPDAEIYLSDICCPELRCDEFDLVLCCDVLYVPGIQRARQGLGKLVERIRAGGLFLIHVPAYDFLKSDHDRVVHTSERYRLAQVRALLSDLELETVLISYRLCSLLPVVIARRLPSILKLRKNRDASELQQPARWLNWLLLVNLQMENRLIARGVRMPFGSSIVAIARKPMLHS